MQDAEIVQLFWNRDERAIREAGSKNGAYCAAINKALEENELFASVATISIKGKVIAPESVKRHYGLK